ncbi:MAG TPA: hypothetical protein VK868_08310 [Pyrinomonadaceae bacterium]|nr:hypothetical protein [Pyrinomonadaceae bacterium]
MLMGSASDIYKQAKFMSVMFAVLIGFLGVLYVPDIRSDQTP